MARLVVNTGQKGGVGETTLSVWEAAMLTKHLRVWCGIDTDLSNQTFAALYPELVGGASIYDKFGYFNPTTMNEIVNLLASKADTDETVIMDVGAGILHVLVAQMKERRLLGADVVLPTTIAYSLIEDVASVSTLRQHINVADGLAGIDWLIVLNEKSGPVSLYLNDAELIAETHARRASQLVLPRLHDNEVFKSLHASGMSLEQYCKSGPNWSYRGMLTTWLERLEPEFERLQHLIDGSVQLGFEASTNVIEAGDTETQNPTTSRRRRAAAKTSSTSAA